jgi:nucleoside-diphosphate-sugar epimerase
MPNQLRILITGANGFIGSHLLKYFSIKSDYKVAGLVRKSSNLFRLGGGRQGGGRQDGGHFDLITASLNDNLERITEGFDVVIHTAGRASDWGSYKDFYQTNVTGTHNLLRSSVQNGVRRFIHYSSTVVYGFKGNRNVTEDQELHPFHNGYCLTKTLSEKQVMGFRDRIELIILRPSNVFGPYDTTATYPMLLGIEKELIGWPKGGKVLTSPCFVRNLVLATEKAIQTKKGLGEAYNITDGNDIFWIDYLSMIATELKKKPPRLSVSSGILYMSALFLEIIYKIFQSSKPPVITPYRIAISSKDYSFSIEKAKILLNYQPRYTTLEGIRESITWYQSLKNPCGEKASYF